MQVKKNWTISRTGHGTMDWIKIEEYVKAVYCHPAYLTYMQSTSCRMPDWMTQGGIKIAEKNINNLRYADDTTLMAENKEELKNFLLNVKEESEKLAYNLTFRKQRSWHPVPWQIVAETMETVTDFIFLGSKITGDGDCSRKIKTHLLLGRKAMTNPDSILKSRDIILLTKVHIVKAIFFQ